MRAICKPNVVPHLNYNCGIFSRTIFVHVTRACVNFLPAKSVQTLVTLQWPARSLDLSPVEHLLDELYGTTCNDVCSRGIHHLVIFSDPCGTPTLVADHLVRFIANIIEFMGSWCPAVINANDAIPDIDISCIPFSLQACAGQSFLTTVNVLSMCLVIISVSFLLYQIFSTKSECLIRETEKR